MAKHSFDSVLFSMADMHLVICLYKWPWMLHSYEWSFYEL